MATVITSSVMTAYFKGATDMWLDGTPIEQIQLLCGHADKSTTEKYIKARWNATAQPNELVTTRN